MLLRGDMIVLLRGDVSGKGVTHVRVGGEGDRARCKHLLGRWLVEVSLLVWHAREVLVNDPFELLVPVLGQLARGQRARVV